MSNPQSVQSTGNCPLGDFLNNPVVKDYMHSLPKKFNEEVVKSTAILSDRDIKAEMENGNIFISPFNEYQLGNCSYDITLGENYYQTDFNLDLGKDNPKFSINPFLGGAVRGYWGYPKKAVTVDHETDNYIMNLHALQIDDKYIHLQSHETILCHSQEFIGGRQNITTMMKARSSLGRMGISITTGGWGDIGFTSRWVMAITNNTNTSMILPVGQRVAQIVFMRTGECNKSYEQRGQYQKSNNMEEVMAKWSPEDMLPKA